MQESSLGYIPRSGISGSWEKSILNLQSDCSLLHSLITSTYVLRKHIFSTLYPPIFWNNVETPFLDWSSSCLLAGSVEIPV